MYNFPYYSPKNIQKVLNDNQVGPRKKWGQNYLIDRNIIDSVFRDIQKKIPLETKSLAEIGIGLGALTHKILDLGYPTELMEIDPVNCRIFEEGMAQDYPREEFRLLQGDCRVHIPDLSGSQPFVFGNLPYYLTSEIITDCLEKIPDMTGFLFLVQKEFAERIVDEVSSLSVFLHGFGKPEKFKLVKKGSFYPSPKIDSMFLFFTSVSDRFLKSPRDIAYFSALLRSSFWGKRKKLSTSIRESPEELFSELKNYQVDSSCTKSLFMSVLSKKQLTEKRPDELSINEWMNIGKELTEQENWQNGI